MSNCLEELCFADPDKVAFRGVKRTLPLKIVLHTLAPLMVAGTTVFSIHFSGSIMLK